MCEGVYRCVGSCACARVCVGACVYIKCLLNA